MSETAELIRNAREQRGLSQRALAERAGVEQSTIARIELGDSDPAYSTVIRLLDAAGFKLPEPQPSIPTLAEAAIGADEIDWTMLRSVTDLAERDPSTVGLLIGGEPATADTIARTILAAVAAFLAEQTGVHTPAWARHTPRAARTLAPPRHPANDSPDHRRDPSRRRPLQRLDPGLGATTQTVVTGAGRPLDWTEIESYLVDVGAELERRDRPSRPLACNPIHHPGRSRCRLLHRIPPRRARPSPRRLDTHRRDGALSRSSTDRARR